MEFWGLEVPAGKGVSVSPEDSGYGYVHITQAALGGDADDARAVCKVQHQKDSIVIGTLVRDRTDQMHLDLVFDQPFHLSHNGKTSVFFVGYRTSIEPESFMDDEADLDDDEEDGDEEEDEDEDDDEEGAVGLNGRITPRLPKAQRRGPIIREVGGEGREEDDDDDDEDDDEEGGASGQPLRANQFPDMGDDGDEDDEDDDFDASDDVDEEDEDDDDEMDDDEDDDDEEEAGEEGGEGGGAGPAGTRATPAAATPASKRPSAGSAATPTPSKKAKLVSDKSAATPKAPGAAPVSVKTPGKDAAKTPPAAKAAAGDKTPKSGASGSKVEGKFRCEPCDRGFQTEQALTQHNKSKHT